MEELSVVYMKNQGWRKWRWMGTARRWRWRATFTGTRYWKRSEEVVSKRISGRRKTSFLMPTPPLTEPSDSLLTTPSFRISAFSFLLFSFAFFWEGIARLSLDLGVIHFLVLFTCWFPFTNGTQTRIYEQYLAAYLVCRKILTYSYASKYSP